jgi:putative methyltransferase (TIGR04325 family)
MTFGYVLSVASRDLSGLKMLDWGGGIGHYYQLARQLHPWLEIDYHCKDVPLLAEHGRKTFPQQHFYADESCLENAYDLVMASGSLQFSEDWKGVLGRLAAAARGHLYLTLLPIVEHVPSFVFVQRPYAYGYDTEYLGWCLNRDELLAAARDHSLYLVRELVMGHQPLIVGAKEQNLYRGFLFSKQSSHA